MITSLTPTVRSGLVAARVAGMTRGVDAALERLASLRSAACSVVDNASIALLISEMFALDARPQEAADAFTKHVEPQLPLLDRRAAVLIADNKTTLAMDSLDPSAADDFYHAVDVRRILGIELRDHAALLEAASEAAAGKHYAALPAYWQQLVSAYALQNWRVRRLAERDFAQECLQLGLLDEAAYHAMLAQSKDMTEKLAGSLLTTRSVQQIEKALRKLLSTCALKRHAVEVARLIARVADAVPDDLLTDVTSFLNMHVTFVPTGWHDAALLEHTWRAVQVLSPRLDEHVAAELAERGVAHPMMQTQNIHRRHVIEAVNELVAKVPQGRLDRVAESALALVGSGKSDIDYREALNLLCHVAHRAPEELKARVRAAVFPPGMQISDLLLIQAGPHLGWVPQKPESFSEGARAAAAAVRKQVQVLEQNEQAVDIGRTMVLSKPTPDGGQIVVQFHGAFHFVEALAAHRNFIDAEALSELVHAMLEMIAHGENVIVNRAGLTSALGKFADRIPNDLKPRVLNVLEPLAAGEIVESSLGQTHAEATNPLNPFRMGSGDPLDLQGAALICLAELDRVQPNASSAFHDRLLLAALTSANAEVRRYGLAAAHSSGDMTAPEQTAIALAGLDADPRVARLALQVLSDRHDDKTFEQATWHILMRILENAAQSSDVGHRRSGARLLTRMLKMQQPPELRARVDAVRAAMQQDVAHSVRRQLHEAT